ncbi:conserved hypothetical protein [Culex quinquefasciatus]|uniref:Uncharacterized protein n=1 Tax=Culex quinquefasciatus TaxID=7176 RepID=B0X081_CULQU|nr:conserved hypothetical protein [Culex quinquefasciatus]|eukprot:XP_001863053.1 conserved hypothetical protein [Culex quinquefasciatus]
MAAAAKADSDWTVHRTKDGKTFYWNKITQDGFQEEKQPLTDKEVENSLKPDPPTPRVRKYQDAPGERWQVFFRPKHKPLQTMQISEELWKHYPGVTDVTKLHQNKLRATVNNPKENNAIVCDPWFCIEYRVRIPARSVEIDGVVSENGLTVQQVLTAVGHFKRRSLPSIPVIEARQMGTAEGEGASKRFVPSSSYRVTFAGTTALPDYLVVDNMLRLTVRMYRPRVMSCSNCKKLGHTAATRRSVANEERNIRTSSARKR